MKTKKIAWSLMPKIERLKKPYCENCFKENLEKYYVDSLGMVFCSKKCFLESQEYREADISSLTLCHTH